MTDFGDMKFPTAAKEHRCEWCGETILIGENHARAARRCHAEPLLERPPGLFRNRRQPLREPFFSLMKVQNEVFGGQLTKSQPGVEELRRDRTASAQHGDSGHQHAADRTLCARHADPVLTC